MTSTGQDAGRTPVLSGRGLHKSFGRVIGIDIDAAAEEVSLAVLITSVGSAFDEGFDSGFA